jgi:hypothetical protein
MALAASAMRSVERSITASISLPENSTGALAGSWVMNCADWIPSAWFTAMNGRITRSYSANAAS